MQYTFEDDIPEIVRARTATENIKILRADTAFLKSYREKVLDELEFQQKLVKYANAMSEANKAPHLATISNYELTIANIEALVSYYEQYAMSFVFNTERPLTIPKMYNVSGTVKLEYDFVKDFIKHCCITCGAF